MNRRSAHGVKPNRPKPSRASTGARPGPPRVDRSHPKATRQEKANEGTFQIIERSASGEQGIIHADPNLPFRILIAVHRPRFRGRSERAAALVGWQVTALLNKQDPVGLCAKPPRPPDVLILSEDFGRQKDLAIFRAVQRYRREGMRIIGLVDDCGTAPEAFPDSLPSTLCDICLPPPYKTAELRALLSQIYTQMRGEAAPPPITRGAEADDIEDEE